MRLLKILMVAAPAVYACGDDAYRCNSRDASASEIQQATRSICDSLGEDMCYCSVYAEDFCDPGGDNIQKFKASCEEYGKGWSATEC